jgi:hypothetical protein
MENASSLTHQELYTALRDNKLDPGSFDHESHIRLAWYYLSRWPYDKACERFNRHFLRFIVKAGAEGKYHKTITDALLQLIASHLEDEQCRSDWEYFKQEAPPLFVDAYGLLQRFYSIELLESDMARKEFKQPDVKDMPEPYRLN